eukprot:6151479-Amphidinium_carterae.1
MAGPMVGSALAYGLLLAVEFAQQDVSTFGAVRPTIWPECMADGLLRCEAMLQCAVANIMSGSHQRASVAIWAQVDYHAAEALESWGYDSEPSSRSLDHLQQLRKVAATVPEDVLKSRCPRLKLLAITTKMLEQLDWLGSLTTYCSAPHAIVAHVRSTFVAIANALELGVIHVDFPGKKSWMPHSCQGL